MHCSYEMFVLRYVNVLSSGQFPLRAQKRLDKPVCLTHTCFCLTCCLSHGLASLSFHFLLLPTSEDRLFSDIHPEDGELGGVLTPYLLRSLPRPECDQDPIVLSSADAATSCASLQ